MRTYTVTFGKQNFDREIIDFTSKKEAEKFYLEKLREGNLDEPVFLDIYDENGDLI